MLRYRLSVLNDVVDTFVLVESTRTFRGREHTPLYETVKDTMFAEYKHKIVHIIVDDMPFPDHTTLSTEKGEQWENEYHQRNCIHRGVQTLSLENDDLILISDVDEIPDPNTLQRIRLGYIRLFREDEFANPSSFCVYILEQDFYYYNLQTKFEAKWLLSKIIPYGFYKRLLDNGRSIQYMRGNSNYLIQKGGWHLSYFGDISFIRNKLLNFAHAEFSTEQYATEDAIQKAIEKKLTLNDTNQVASHPDNTYVPPNPEFWTNLQKV
jgi:beta-1,4-mannosyl-glycoprotein beta-1,4-N-acetylglucosaminyltransferase